MKSKALHGYIDYVKDRVHGIEEAKTYNIALGLSTDTLPRISHETIDLLIGRAREYDSNFFAVGEEDIDYNDEVEDEENSNANLALQEPDIYL